MLSKLSFDAWTDVDSGRFRRSNSVRSGTATPTSQHRVGSSSVLDADSAPPSPQSRDASLAGWQDVSKGRALSKDPSVAGWQENGNGKAMLGRVSSQRPSRLSVTTEQE